MHHYRQALLRMRQGDSDRDIAAARVMAISKAAADGMRFMYLAGYQVIKAGVMLVDLQSASVQQRELQRDDLTRRRRIHAIDRV
jgi:hypothetical protein